MEKNLPFGYYSFDKALPPRKISILGQKKNILLSMDDEHAELNIILGC